MDLVWRADSLCFIQLVAVNIQKISLTSVCNHLCVLLFSRSAYEELVSADVFLWDCCTVIKKGENKDRKNCTFLRLILIYVKKRLMERITCCHLDLFCQTSGGFPNMQFTFQKVKYQTDSIFLVQLQARDEVITVLKAEKIDLALLEAKYGFVTPQKVLQALQRDAIQGKTEALEEDIYEKPMVEVR